MEEKPLQSNVWLSVATRATVAGSITGYISLNFHIICKLWFTVGKNTVWWKMQIPFYFILNAAHLNCCAAACAVICVFWSYFLCEKCSGAWYDFSPLQQISLELAGAQRRKILMFVRWISSGQDFSPCREANSVVMLLRRNFSYQTSLVILMTSGEACTQERHFKSW